MLELRPSCENCRCELPPAATNARICTFECTFCSDCVDTVLHNVCPNCGGGFTPRPVRTAHNWVGEVSLQNYPPSATRVEKPVDPQSQAALIRVLGDKPPEQR